MGGRGLSFLFVELRFNWEERRVLWAEGRVRNWKLAELDGGS